MKRLFALLFSVFLGISGNAQGNLQFNQVKYFQLNLTQSSSGTFDVTTLAITVPANKVWKIEAAAATSYSPSTGSHSFGGRITLDGNLLSDFYSTPGQLTNLPFWLPAGTYNLELRSSTSTPTFYFKGGVSVIEFNVVP